MLLTRVKLFVLGALILGLGGTTAFTQPGGGGKGGFRGPDPDKQFDNYAKGKEVITISEVEVDPRFAQFFPSEKLREGMTTYLKEKGISGGTLSREQFRDYSTWSQAKMAEQWGGKGGGGMQGKGGGGEYNEDRARDSFKRLDKNNDGVLNAEELEAMARFGSPLANATEREKYDLNKDGVIDLNEYLEYSKARATVRSEGKDGGKGDKGSKGEKSQGYTGRGLDEEKPRVVVPEEKRITYRYGSLPKDLPAWYAELDKDKDGQIGLYEWRAAGKDVKDFVAMDANGDGFITVEEYYRFQKAASAKKAEEGGNPLLAMVPSTQSSALSGSTTQSKDKGKGKGGYPNFGDGGGGGKGKGKGGFGGPRK
jgi:hypothetical protein